MVTAGDVVRRELSWRQKKRAVGTCSWFVRALVEETVDKNGKGDGGGGTARRRQRHNDTTTQRHSDRTRQQGSKEARKQRRRRRDERQQQQKASKQAATGRRGTERFTTKQRQRSKAVRTCRRT